MNNPIIAICGITCNNCPAYQATQSGKQVQLQEVLAHWQQEFNATHISVEDILCDGCRPSSGRLNGYCQQCKIRACARSKELPNCAHCDEYPCAQLEHLLAICDQQQEGYFAYATQARPTLARIYAEQIA